MRLVFTKLETPLNYIEVDIGTGTFEEFSLEDLQDSETGKYIQLPDTIPANSIRVKTNSSELESFDMIKEYQITDDEGNILGESCNESGASTPDYILILSSDTDCFGSLYFYGASSSVLAGTYKFVIVNKYGNSFDATETDLTSMGWSLDGDTVTFDSDFESPSGNWQVDQHSIDCQILLFKK